MITGQMGVLKELNLGGKSLSMYQGFCRTRQSSMCQVNWKELGQGYHWESYLDGLGKADLPGYNSVLYELLDKVQ